MTEKKLVVCDDIMKNGHVAASKFCAPVFIASSSFGTLLSKEEDLVFKHIQEGSVRSGTLTFIRYRGELLALTCRHVVLALRQRREQWRSEMFKKYKTEPDHVPFHLYTPIGLNQFHFFYELTPVPPNLDGSEPDVAIARVDIDVITRLGRVPLVFADKKTLPETGIACGYPEQQRTVTAGEHLNNLAPKFVACTATLQVTGKGDLLLQDEISESNGVDNLSGMSGGPILWSDHKRFGLAGIVYEGSDIQGGEGRLMEGSGIWIRGERISTSKLDEWLLHIPRSSRVDEHSKSLYVPSALR